MVLHLKSSTSEAVCTAVTNVVWSLFQRPPEQYWQQKRYPEPPTDHVIQLQRQLSPALRLCCVLVSERSANDQQNRLVMTEAVLITLFHRFNFTIQRYFVPVAMLMTAIIKSSWFISAKGPVPVKNFIAPFIASYGQYKYQSANKHYRSKN